MQKLCKVFAPAIFLFLIDCSLNIYNCEAQWQSDFRLTNNPANSYLSLNNAWCVAVSGNLVHVVWHDYRDGINAEIYYKRSTDGGISWGTDTRLTNNSAESIYPSVSVYGLNVYAVWCDSRDLNEEIYYKRSTDGGVTWGTDTRLTNNSAESRNQSVSISNSVVHIAWRDFRDGNHEIYYKRSTDGGVSWGNDLRLTINAAESREPSLTISGSFVHVVWWDNRDGNYEIYYKRSTDEGVSWGADIRLTNNAGDSEAPSLTVTGSMVHVIWHDYRDGINAEIYCKRSTDGGVSWGGDARLTNNPSLSWYPSVSVSGSNVHVVWMDNRDGNNEIYYRFSTDGGISWGADTRLTNYAGDSHLPSITLSGSILHVVWYDDRDGNYEIYYKRNPTGNILKLNNISSEVPSAYSLSQNYPNPFNPKTNIKFDVTSEHSFGGDHVKIVVYDVMGRKVQTLVNERLQPGTYETSFDGFALNSGVYFYKITAGDFSDTKRMLMIK